MLEVHLQMLARSHRAQLKHLREEGHRPKWPLVLPSVELVNAGQTELTPLPLPFGRVFRLTRTTAGLNLETTRWLHLHSNVSPCECRRDPLWIEMRP